MKRIAEAHRELFKMGSSFELSAGDQTAYRVIPAIEPTEKLLEINTDLSVQHQIMPYEILREYLSAVKPEIFAVIPCSCRTAYKLAGNPCKQTNENFCVTTGTLAKLVLDNEIGREVTLEGLMEIMERAEKDGLVHETFNVQNTATFICNCCSCCCGFLKSAKEHKNYGTITKSNFDPIIDSDSCTLCETCMNICPMDAIYHHWPHKVDLSDNFMSIRLDLCIGCGVCASNCPTEAIVLEKVRNVVPIKDEADMIAKYYEGKTH
jgi:formate hydrogenlyase subunit 6/NADH:ubiquinone oxidoreductase subunit I